MLPAQRRVRRREDFSATVRDGRRAGAPGLVAHVSTSDRAAPARAGFIVGRTVGPAVVRNRIRRQLRHLIAPHLAAMPAGTDVVIRVTPSTLTRTSHELAAVLDNLIERILNSSISGARR